MRQGQGATELTEIVPKMAFRPVRKAHEKASPDAGTFALTTARSSEPPASRTRPPMKANADTGRKSDLTVKICLAALGLVLHQTCDFRSGDLTH